MTNATPDLSLGQFVKQLAALLQKRDVQLPFKNQRPWHLLFYKLKTLSPAPGRPEFFDHLRFDWDAPYPRSQELSEFLNALHFTASVSARNPSYDVISVSKEVADRWAQSANHDDPNLKKFVDTAVTLAQREFSAAQAA
jgi:hypothetical protein